MFPAVEGCRNCDLIYYYHRQFIPIGYYEEVKNRYICPCENFEPLDNLKYLEMKYMQMKQEKYDINKRNRLKYDRI